VDTFTPAVELAAAIRRRELSPLELAEACLERIDAQDPELNAFVLRDDERVLRDARRATEAVTAAGADGLGPFHGVPLPIKDLAQVAGWPTTYGSRGASPTPAATSQLVVRRFTDAGFVLLGKTATPEFGTISYTESQRHGVTRNPWNTDHTPGGSSGGAAAAVAAGMAPIAHASDGGGSIRIPASCCGLVGLKPSRNRVPTEANRIEGFTTDGVVTRTVADTAAVLDVIARPDPLSWYNAPPASRAFAEAARSHPPRLRVGVVTRAPLDLPLDPECRVAVEAVGRVLEQQGHDVSPTELTIPDAERFAASFSIVWSTGSSGLPLADWDAIEPLNAAVRARAREVDALAYTESVLRTQLLSRAVVRPLVEDVDVLVMPTMTVEPPPCGSVWEGADDDPMAPLMNSYPMAVFTSVWNVTGTPALSLPVHPSPSGLPVGVQLVAGPWRDDLLLQLGAVLEEAMPWQDRRPPVAV
jgi:amidase